jgi:WD40 repeat protein/tRNA A-37 threonylcarbamoyl transferase component Bud32
MPSAEDLFADYLEVVEAGEDGDIDALCGAHPEHAEALRRMHLRWRAMTKAFTALSQAGVAAKPIDAVSESVEALMARLRASPGRRVRYAIGAELARGAMGRVVQAWDEELRREVALKIQRDAGGDTRVQRRFLEEAQITGQLDHPGIVPIHELGLDEAGRPFFAMRLVRGRDLAEVLDCVRNGRDGWTRTRVLHVLLRVCEALAYAHDKGVVHRDVKPGNVMVGRFGETYVMDWGLARVVGESGQVPLDSLRDRIADESADSPLLTQHGDVVGTPAYMPPEQAAGGEVPVTPALDVYALGAILYHLCAGHMPYASAGGDRLTARDIVQLVRSSGPPPLGDDVPAELRAIQERAMARDAAARYPSVDALAEDLRAFLELRVVKAYATGRFAELRKWIARNRAVSLATAIAFVALVVFLVVSTRLWIEADDAAARLTAELDRSEFRNARLSLGTDDAGNAEDVLWQQHFEGRSPRATTWALSELLERTPCIATVQQPTSGQVPVVFLPRANEVLCAGNDGSLHALDGTSLAARRQFESGSSAIQELLVDRSGEFVIAGCADGALLVFEAATGALRRRVQAHVGGLRALALSPTAPGFASGGHDGRVLLWAGFTAEPVELTRHDAEIWSLRFDDEGKRLASGDELGWVRIVDLASSAVSRRRVATDNAMAFSFTPEHDGLWVGSADQYLHLMRTEPWSQQKAIPTRNGTCRGIVRDDDGSLIVGGWWRIDRIAADGETREPIALRGVWKFDLDRARRRIAASHSGVGVSLYELENRGLQLLAGSNFGLSGDGRRIAIDIGGAVMVRSVDGSEALDASPLAPRGGWLAMNRDGTRVALMTGQPWRVEVYDVDARARLFVVDGPDGTPFNECFAFHPGGRELAVLVGRDLIRRVDATSGAVLGETRLAGGTILRIRYARDGHRMLVVQSGLAAVRLLDPQSGAFEDVPFPFAPLAAAWSPDGKRVACGLRSGTLWVRDLESGALREIRAHSGVVWSLEFSPTDPGLLVSTGGANGLAFWDLDSGLACLSGDAEEAPVAQVQISDDGRTLAAYTYGGIVLRDLEYHERHIAGNLGFQLDRLRRRMTIPPARERELRAWAEQVLVRPWPRWR